MNEQNDTPSIAVSVSMFDIGAIATQFGDDGALEHSIRSAAVVILPTDLGFDNVGPAFPFETRELFRRLSESFSGKWTAEVAAREVDYFEFDFRSDSIIIPTLYIGSQIALPIVLNVISSFIHDKIGYWRNANSSGTAEGELYVEKPDGTKVWCRYKGPASTLEQITKHISGD